MTKQDILKYFDAIKTQLEGVVQSCKEGKLDDWSPEACAFHSSLHISSRFQEKNKDSVVEVPFTLIRSTYEAVINALGYCQNEFKDKMSPVTETKTRNSPSMRVLSGTHGTSPKKRGRKRKVDLPKVPDEILAIDVSDESSAPSSKEIAFESSAHTDNSSPRKSSRLAGRKRTDYQQLADDGVVTNKDSDGDGGEACEPPQREDSVAAVLVPQEAESRLFPVIIPDIKQIMLFPQNDRDAALTTNSQTVLDHEYGAKPTNEAVPEEDVNPPLDTSIGHQDESSADMNFGVQITVEGTEIGVLHPSNELKHQCGICKEWFASIFGFKRHVRRSHKQTTLATQGDENASDNDKPKNQTCRLCQKAYADIISFRDHMVTHCMINNTYICLVCKGHFQGKKEFNSHMMQFHGDTSYQDLPDTNPTTFNCEYCDFQSNSIIDLIVHAKEDHTDSIEKDFPVEKTAKKSTYPKGPRSYICTECKKSFSRSNDLARHMLTHDKTLRTDKGYECKHCPEIFSNILKYLKHPCIAKDPDRRLSGKGYNPMKQRPKKCPQCGKFAPGPAGIPIHIITHYKSEKGYVCKQCRQAYKSATSFYTHLKKKHEQTEFDPEEWLDTSPGNDVTLNETHIEQGQVTKCGECGRVCASVSALKRHIRMRHGNAQKSEYLCSSCPAKYKNKVNLVLHERKTHTGEKPFKCDYCEMTFIGRRHLQRHISSHTGVKKHMCEICGKGFVEKQEVVRHMRHAHMPVEKNEICPHCSKAFRTATQLKVHIRSHTGEKPYQCEFCPAAFNQPGPLKYHRSIHTGEKPYVCELCGKAFPTMTAAKKHLKGCSNTGNVSYQCEHCSKQFKRLENLTRHLATHQNQMTEIIMYQCDLCEEKFLLEKSLHDHKLAAHPPLPEDQTSGIQEAILLSDIQNANGETVTIYITQ